MSEATFKFLLVSPTEEAALQKLIPYIGDLPGRADSEFTEDEEDGLWTLVEKIKQLPASQHYIDEDGVSAEDTARLFLRKPE